MTTEPSETPDSPPEREEWVLAKNIVEHLGQATPAEAAALATEVLRLRDLAEIKYELAISSNGRELYDIIKPRIDKLYMSLNARGRGDETDMDGDPAQPWNNLVGTLATALAHWLANARWAVLEHRSAERMRAAALPMLEKMACRHEFDPECARCELLAPLRQAVKDKPEKPEGAVTGKGE